MDAFTGKDQFIETKPKYYSAESKDIEELIKPLSYFLDDCLFEYINIIGNPYNINKESNSLNFILGLRNGKLYLLKKIPKKNIDTKTISQITKLMDWCKNSGIIIPDVCSTKTGELFIEGDNYFWILMEYIDGVYFSGEDNQFNDTAIASGYLLNALSNLPSEFQPSKLKEPYFSEKENQVFLNINNSQSNWDEIFGEYFSNKLSNNWKYLNDQWNYINSHNFISYKYNSIIHHDLHPGNFIFSNNKTYIIDYESIIIGPLQSAIGFAVIKLLKRKNYKHGNNKNKNYLLNLSNEWISTVSDIIPSLPKKNEIEIFGRAEVFRRFLSMSNKAILKIPSSFNGPEVHLDSLLIADKIFSS